MIIANIGYTNEDFVRGQHSIIFNKDGENQSPIVSFKDELMKDTDKFISFIKENVEHLVTDEKEITIKFYSDNQFNEVIPV